MPCYHPHRVVFEDHSANWGLDPRNSWVDPLLPNQRVGNIACRKCLGCNTNRSREWSLRIFHEGLSYAQDWRDPKTGVVASVPNSAMVTLTYRPEDLPEPPHLDYGQVQLFMKHLRKRRDDRGDSSPIKFFCAGEYGGKTHRPHYHLVLFGETFNDRYTSEDPNTGKVYHHSYELDSIWGNGRATIDDLTYLSGAYVAGYVAKKSNAGNRTGPVQVHAQTYKTAPEHYSWPAPEFQKMSNHPGLGHDWFMRPENMAKVIETDSIQIGEYQFSVPPYYSRLLAREYPLLMPEIKAKRLEGLYTTSETWTPARCSSAEEIALQDLQRRRDSL